MKLVKVLKFIYQNNKGLFIIKYLFLGCLYFLFKNVYKYPFAIRIFNGKKIFQFPESPISSFFSYTKIPDNKEITLLRSVVKSTEKPITFLDIGANIGSYSICMMDVCKKVIAFEPHPISACRCKMNFLLNDCDENQVHQIALGSNNGTTRITDYGNSSTINQITELGAIKVGIRTLDYVTRTSDDYFLIKIDVEGFEKEVLKGMVNLLKQNHVIGILFESFDQKAIEFLNNNGFKSIQKVSTNNYYVKTN